MVGTRQERGSIFVSVVLAKVDSRASVVCAVEESLYEVAVICFVKTLHLHAVSHLSGKCASKVHAVSWRG